MANLFDYLEWRGDLPLSFAPFNCVDSLILSQFAYMPYEGVDKDFTGDKTYVLKDLAKALHEADLGYYSNSPMEDDKKLLELLPKSQRFRDMTVTEYENIISTKEGIQFSAVVFLSEDGFINIVYRGTDGTIVGWEEDFKLSYSTAIPSQVEALKYLKKIAKNYKGKIRLMGHSKGGNLAIYAAAHAPKYIQKRIQIIYCNEGPGFSVKEMAFPGHKEIKDKIEFYVPSSSVVGMLLLHNVRYKVIKSSSFSLGQHVAYTWQVNKDGYVPAKLSKVSQLLQKTLNDWYRNLKEDDLKIYVSTIFKVIYSSKAQTLQDFTKKGLTKTIDMINAMGHLDKETKAVVIQVFKDLFKAGLNTIKEDNFIYKLATKSKKNGNKVQKALPSPR